MSLMKWIVWLDETHVELDLDLALYNSVPDLLGGPFQYTCSALKTSNSMYMYNIVLAQIARPLLDLGSPKSAA